ncbi:MAG TPA: DUF924 family protein [Micropepsaceae bacterium]|jgi:uncharacterized protein (DUF924 family)|nr:DUF924 family protein [Micropepsaceae bacterium]
MTLATPHDILDFWFKQTPPERWFSTDAAFDSEVRRRFEESWRAGRDGAFGSWANSMEGALALIVLFDQFPRNMFRGQAAAFSTDTLAREIARAALAKGFDREAPAAIRSFFYLPFMHSEDLQDQETSVHLTRERLGESHFSYPFAVRHRDIIARFGRFPARNAAQGRHSTPEEIDLLKANPNGF